jgi:glutamate-ammonia-ligase adenylyltransferase
LRLGSRDILALVDFEQNLGELSSLADACLQYALESVMTKHKMRNRPPFAVVGLGKLGGREITYGFLTSTLFLSRIPKRKICPLYKSWAGRADGSWSRRRTEQRHRLCFKSMRGPPPDG